MSLVRPTPRGSYRRCPRRQYYVLTALIVNPIPFSVSNTRTCSRVPKSLSFTRRPHGFVLRFFTLQCAFFGGLVYAPPSSLSPHCIVGHASCEQTINCDLKSLARIICIRTHVSLYRCG